MKINPRGIRFRIFGLAYAIPKDQIVTPQELDYHFIREAEDLKIKYNIKRNL